jgi:hypothetical protein
MRLRRDDTRSRSPRGDRSDIRRCRRGRARADHNHPQPRDTRWSCSRSHRPGMRPSCHRRSLRHRRRPSRRGRRWMPPRGCTAPWGCTWPSHRPHRKRIGSRRRRRRSRSRTLWRPCRRHRGPRGVQRGSGASVCAVECVCCFRVGGAPCGEKECEGKATKKCVAHAPRLRAARPHAFSRASHRGRGREGPSRSPAQTRS